MSKFNLLGSERSSEERADQVQRARQQDRESFFDVDEKFISIK